MPLSKHFGGHGAEVMADMRKRYGDKAERIFYATENARKNDVGNAVDRERRKHELKRNRKG